MDYRDFFIPLVLFAFGLLVQLIVWNRNVQERKTFREAGSLPCAFAGGWTGWMITNYYFSMWVEYYDPIKYGGWVIWGLGIGASAYLCGWIVWRLGPVAPAEMELQLPEAAGGHSPNSEQGRGIHNQ